MNLENCGKLICNLRKSKNMTQKQLADKLHIQAKTVSKWETGHGFPDTSLLSDLAKILEVTPDTILKGDLKQNIVSVGNMKNIKFYICPCCGSFIQGVGEFKPTCCGKTLLPLKIKTADENHRITVSEAENDYYITFEHEMTKQHFISLIAYVASDRVLTIKLYPEQASSVRFPKMYGGRLLYYCNNHGLFEYSDKEEKKEGNPTSLTALISAFARAYVNENSNPPLICDNITRKFFTDAEFSQIEKYISSTGSDISEYVRENLAPTPCARSKFFEDCFNTSVLTGTAQCVILGCGFDTFSFRNTYKSVKIYEIDKPDVIKEKLRRAKRANLEIPENVRYIPCDLSKQNLAEVLSGAGFDTNKKTIFSLLGVSYYLETEETERLLKQISDICRDGSSIVFDLADSQLFTSNNAKVKNMVAMADAAGEKMKSCFGYSELEKMLEKYDFLIYEFLNSDQIQNRYFDANTFKMSAFPHIDYAHAVLKKQ